MTHTWLQKCFKNYGGSPAGIAQPLNQEVPGWIPGQNTCPGFVGDMQKTADQYFYFSIFSPFSLSLSQINEKAYPWLRIEKKKRAQC